MSISKIPKDRLGPLGIGSADIGTAGLPVNVLSQSGATDGQYLRWNASGTAWQPTAIPSPVNFVDAEVPTGTKDGINKIFTLAGTPSPTSSLQVFVSGQLMTAGSANDYIISGNTVTFTVVAPGVNDPLLAYYRK